MTKTRVLWATLLTAGLLGPAYGQAAPRQRLVNPIAGYAVDLPLDYELSTGGLGETTMGINVTNYGSPSTPLYSFFHCQPSPREGAGLVAQFIGAVYRGAEVKVSPGQAEEWQVSAAGATDLTGPVLAQWFLRPGRKMNYGVSFYSKVPTFQQHREEITAVIGSFRQIERIPLRVARDTTENAYKVTMPAGWSHQGRIHRSPTCPGWPVWQASSPDGRSGCFEMPPGQATTMPLAARDIAGTYLLQGVQKEVPTVQNLRVERVTLLPRGGAAIVEVVKSMGGASLTQPAGEKALVDYLGTVNGAPVRLRVYTTSYYIPFYGRPDLPGNFNWFIWGLWAPVDSFEANSGVAHSVHGALQYDRKWQQAQRKAVDDVLGRRREAYDKANKEWMDHIRGSSGGTDPQTGKPLDVPEGTEPYRHETTGDIQYFEKDPGPPWRRIDWKKD